MFEAILADLNRRLVSFDVVGQGPDDNVDDTDEVMGVLPDELRKLFSIARSAKKKFERAMSQPPKFSELSTEEVVALGKRHATLSHEASFLHEMFWRVVDETFPKTIGLPRSIRRGWIVVVPKEEFLIKTIERLFERIDEMANDGVTVVPADRFDRAMRILNGEDAGVQIPKPSAN